MSRFKPVDLRINFAKQEDTILSFWQREKIFEKSLALRAKADRYVFFEGPPTANGKPGIHHALGRYFKDLFPRFKTMQGYLVERKAGWDTHGLPVEIAVEKELGFSGKADIEKYGIAKFNAKAQESAWEYKDLWEKFTARLGYWLDMNDPYVTYNPKYIESVWWTIKQIWDRDLIYLGHRVSPWCPRCGTVLSSHELAQGYQMDTDTSVYVKFKVKGHPERSDSGVEGSNKIPRQARNDNFSGDTYILAWTTTPWTLPGNVALAVGNDISYCKVKSEKLKVKSDGVASDEFYILAEDLIEKVFDGEAVEILEKLKGKDLLGLEYEPLFPDAIPEDTENLENAFKVVPADFVTTEDGTGIVHTAVMYGEDDYQLGAKLDLPKVHTVDQSGNFLASVAKWTGRSVNDPKVTEEIVEDLESRGLLLKEEKYKHEYPHCWRCDTKLIYYATDSWFISVSKVREQLVANNATVNWIPEHIKEGRFGEWLKEAKDWAISRARYWGTPLPIWASTDGKYLCVGSYEELSKLAGRQVGGSDWDPHRPFVDDVVLVKDGVEYTRVPEVMDVWFDSGAMPYAQWHYPFENKERIDGISDKSGLAGKPLAFPADFIAEGVDQTRGWFYTLLVISTLLDKKAPYKNVMCFGHILDKHGKKMSKSKGNVVDPWEMFDKYGSDILRWYFYTINQPGLPKNFDEQGLTQVTRRFVLTLWNTYSFFVMYANIDGFDPDNGSPSVSREGANAEFENVLDRWILARRDELVATVTKSLEKYEPMAACLAIETFVDDLSNWYVRRSRRRFWKSEDQTDKNQAYSALYAVLKDVITLLAPMMPFLSEAIYANLRGQKDPESIHLADWPKIKDPDTNVLEQMKHVRDIVEAGLNQREQAGLKIRQPLASVSITESDLTDELKEIIREELNVKEVKTGAKKLSLDTALTDELILEGYAREIVRAIQIMRKEHGFDVTDRITIEWGSDSEIIRSAFDVWNDYIVSETLTKVLKGPVSNDSPETKINDSVVKLKITKV